MWYTIYLLTAIGLTPGGSSIVHIYTQTIHRTTQWKQNIQNGTYITIRIHKLNDNILVNDQPDAQLFYFIIRLLQSYTCFEQRRAHHQEVKLY